MQRISIRGHSKGLILLRQFVKQRLFAKVLIKLIVCLSLQLQYGRANMQYRHLAFTVSSGLQLKLVLFLYTIYFSQYHILSV